jgi:CHAT domain-containing protein
MNTLKIFKWLIIIPIVFWIEVAFPQDGHDKAFWLSELQKIEENKNPIQSKINLLEDLLNSYNKQNAKDLFVAKVLSRLGEYYCQIGDSGKGIELLKKAVSSDRSSTNPLYDHSFLANAYYNLGFYCNKLNLFEEFQLYMDSCISISMNFPGQKEIGIHAYEQLAVHYNSIGEYHKSIDFADNGIFIGETLTNNLYTALLYLQKAQAEMALSYNERDSVYIGNAEKNIQKAIEILVASNDKKYISIAFAMKARLLEQSGEIESAIRLYENAFSIDYLAKNYTNAVKIKSYLGLLYDAEGHPEKALETYRSCFDLIKKINYPAQAAMEEASIYTNIGVVYYFKEDYQNALENFQKGIDVLLAQNTESPHDPQVFKNYGMSERMPVIRSLYSNLGETILKQFHKKQIQKTELKQALMAFLRADKAVDQMRWNQSNQLSKLLWTQQTKSMYEMAIEVCYLLNDTDKAFYFFEKSRAVLLNDKLSELGAHQYLSEEDQENEKLFRIQLVNAQQKLSLLEKSDLKYQQFTRDRFEKQEGYEKFIKSLEKKYPSYYQYKYDTLIPSISDLRTQVLEKDQSFVEYFTGDKHLYFLAIDQDSATLNRMEIDHKNNISELLDICAERSTLNQNYSRYRELAHQLYKDLFAPLAIQTKRVIISPNDNFFPFELLLRDKNNPNSFLMEEHAFSYTYSARYLMKNNKKGSIEMPTLMGMAPVNYQSYLQQVPLNGADLSLSNLSRQFSSSALFTNEKATKQEFIQNLPRYTIVHLYSHAEVDEVNAEFTLFFNDSSVRVSDLQLLGNLSTKLIVLSACKTGVGKVLKGEGVFSMARGFAAAGIPSSITSLWQIDNHSTYQINELFYKYLGEGLPLDVALQEAKLEFLRTQDKTHDLPYFWAASILIGNSDGFLPEKPLLSFPNIVAGISIILLLISALIYKKKFIGSPYLNFIQFKLANKKIPIINSWKNRNGQS